MEDDAEDPVVVTLAEESPAKGPEEQEARVTIDGY